MALSLEDLFSEPPPKIKLTENSSRILQDKTLYDAYNTDFNLTNDASARQTSKTEWKSDDNCDNSNVEPEGIGNAIKTSASMISDSVSGDMQDTCTAKSKIKCKKPGNKNRKHHSKCRLSAHKLQQALAENANDDMDFFGEAQPRQTPSNVQVKLGMAPDLEGKGSRNVQFCYNYDQTNGPSNVKQKKKNRKKGKKSINAGSETSNDKDSSLAVSSQIKSKARKWPVRPSQKQDNKSKKSYLAMPLKNETEATNCEDPSLVLLPRIEAKPHKWPVSQRNVDCREQATKFSNIKETENDCLKPGTKINECLPADQSSCSVLDQILSQSSILQSATLFKTDFSDLPSEYESSVNPAKCNKFSNEVFKTKQVDLLKVNTKNRVSRYSGSELNPASVCDSEEMTISSGFFAETQKVDTQNSDVAMCEKSQSKDNLLGGKANHRQQKIIADDLVIVLEEQIESGNEGKNNFALNDKSNHNIVKKKIRKYSAEYTPRDVSQAEPIQEAPYTEDNKFLTLGAAANAESYPPNVEEGKWKLCQKPQEKKVLVNLQSSFRSNKEKAATMKTNPENGPKSLLDLVCHAPLDMAVAWKQGIQSVTMADRKRGGKKRKDRKREPTGVPTKKDSSYLPQEKKPRVLCKYFKDGKCRMGKDCNFLHEGKPERRSLCKYYATDCCLLGDDCIFMHDDFPCKFFHAFSCCSNGDGCKYSHEPLTDETSQLLQQAIIREVTDRFDNSSTAEQGKEDQAVSSVVANGPGLYEPLQNDQTA